jgi:hypothetical protein
MGDNAVLILRHEDLESIALDNDFGAKLHDLLGQADRLPIRRNLVDDTYSGISLRWDTEIPADYDILISKPLHADITDIHVYDGKGLASFRSSAQHSWKKAITLAAAFASLGYRVEQKAHRFLREPEADSAVQNAGISLETGATALTICLDARDAIREDTELGLRFALGIKDHLVLSQRADLPYFPQSCIAALNHVNALDIIGHMSGNQTKVFLTGQNCGRMLHKDLPPRIQLEQRESHKKHLIALRNNDLKEVNLCLREFGFHVRSPGRSRAESPMHWSKASWVSPVVSHGGA